MIRSDMLGEFFPFERVIDCNLKTIFGVEDLDTFLVNGIGDKDSHRITP